MVKDLKGNLTMKEDGTGFARDSIVNIINVLKVKFSGKQIPTTDKPDGIEEFKI